jgi:hypothetical protein
MSYITEITIIGAKTRDIEALNAWLADTDEERQQQFRQVSFDRAGGSKFYASDVWAAAFNYGPMEELIRKLADHATWSHCLLSVMVTVDAEGERSMFMFGGEPIVIRRIEEA